MGKRGPESSAPGGYGTITPKGYRRIWDTDELRARMEHDVIWEEAHGPIPDGYCIHHKNEDKLDNRLANLELLDHLTHKRIHSGCELRDGEWWKPCGKCGEMKPVTDYYERDDGIDSYCKQCCIEVAVKNKRKRKARARIAHAEKTVAEDDDTCAEVSAQPSLLAAE